MKQTIRRIAVSGSAAVALLGGAATIGAATAPPASATTMQTVIDEATGAPVKLPGGKTTYVRGMDAAAYRASDEHTRTITLAAAGKEDDPADEIGSGLTPDGGQGAPIQNPNNQAPAGPNQQINTQAGGGTIAVSIVAILILGILVWVKVKHSGLKAIDATLGVLFGIALSGTIIGSMGSQMTNSLVGSLGTMLGGMG
ncbi:hypothetical protein ACFYO9_37340 [Streptomyces sp. NPDC005863]|uniref:hypothetical protein n=1 Tax=Streptomyces sp. NPDC005863 TaxID=3364735 RepID=UPI00367FD3E5